MKPHPSGPPTPIEPGGTYAHSPPCTWTPYLGKRISKDKPPIYGIGYRGQLPNKKNPGFPGNLPETTARIPPFPEKMGTRMRPPYAFEWGPGPHPHPEARRFIREREPKPSCKVISIVKFQFACLFIIFVIFFWRICLHGPTSLLSHDVEYILACYRPIVIVIRIT